MSATLTILPDATSRVSNGTAGTVINGATFETGYNATATNHALLRYQTGGTLPTGLPTSENVVLARLSFTLSSVPGTVGDRLAYNLLAADYGAAVAEADWGSAGTPHALTNDPASTYGVRVLIDQLFAAGASAPAINTPVTMLVPTRFINTGTTVNSGFSDFELRPKTTPTAGQTMTWHGPTAVTSEYRPFLYVESLNDTELRAQNSHRFKAIGAESYVAFAPERIKGAPVKARVLLDAKSSTLDVLAENLVDISLNRNRVRPRKIAIGRAGAGGEIMFSVTPEKCLQLLPGLMKRNATSGAGPYTHEFKPCTTDEIRTYTFVQKEGPFRMVYPGCMISSLSLSAGLDEVVNASIGVEARNEWVYDTNSAGEDDQYIMAGSAAYDSVANSVLSFVGAQVSFGDVGGTLIADQGLVQNCSINIRQSVNECRGLNRQREVASHYALGFEAELNFTMYFENEWQYRKFINDASREFPTKPQIGTSIQLQQIEFSFAGALGVDTQEIKITAHKVMFTTVRKPIGSEGAIMLECSGSAVFDDGAANANITIEVTNSEVSALFDLPAVGDGSPGSVDAITVLPRGVIVPTA
jgi:hypothetical protein